MKLWRMKSSMTQWIAKSTSKQQANDYYKVVFAGMFLGSHIFPYQSTLPYLLIAIMTATHIPGHMYTCPNKYYSTLRLEWGCYINVAYHAIPFFGNDFHELFNGI